MAFLIALALPYGSPRISESRLRRMAGESMNFPQ
jgi:hypothetical protein